MKIDLTLIDKEVLIRCINEENERDNFTRSSLSRQVETKQTYGRQKEFEDALERYNHKKEYFINLCKEIPNIDVINIVTEDHIKFWKELTENQIYISNSRIEDWSVGGDMYESCKKRNLEDFDEACQKIRNLDLESIKCMKIIDLMIDK